MFGKIIEYTQTGQKIKINFEYQSGEITVINPRVFHVYSDFGADRIPSKAVVDEKIIKTNINVTRKEDAVRIQTDVLTVWVYDDFKIDVYDGNGNALCRDYRGKRMPRITISKESAELMKKEGHKVALSKDKYQIEVVKEMMNTAAFYGLGDMTGFLNKKGYAYELWNSDNPMPHVDSFKSLYKSIPFMIAKQPDSAYGIFMDNTFHSYWDFGQESTDYYYFAADGGNLNYYFYSGKSIKEIISAYIKMTGTVPVPQMWTLGYHQSRWGYESRSDILEIAEKMRQFNIPCDAIHFDIDYMEQFKVFTFDKEKYGEPRELMKLLAEKGFKAVAILDPGVKAEEGYDIYEEGKKGNYFATTPEGEIYTNVVWPGEAVYPDFGRYQVRQWWSQKIKRLVDYGFRGIWNDMNEPAGFAGEIPPDIVFGDEEAKSTHAQMHNVYGHMMSEAAYEGMQKHDKRRPFVITRACYAGSWRYACTWTGDNHSIWSHLQMVVPQLCNLGMSGMGFAGTDIGGFGSDATAELLIRWIQIGCFSPMCRNHSSKVGRYQEPWQFDEEVCRIYKKYVELRYQLLPYIYDCFCDMAKTGIPVMRPLVLAYENDPDTWELNDEFMLGENMLIAPVTTQGSRKRMVYLPKGDWIDFDTEELIQGPGYFIKDAPLDTCPVYVKAGTILPNYPVQQYVGEKEITELTLRVYQGSGDYYHYQDDGESFQYRQGEYNLYHFSIAPNGRFHMQCMANGYKKGYKSLRIIYKGKEQIVPIQDEISITL
ncbi:MAG: glycoside hydrolase family 31 protein [Lachnospiraceae bacterium]|nr:glycoside hydrolase family 31 protein [Lachnospiraceae bacterium]